MLKISHLRHLVEFKQTMHKASQEAFGHMLQGEQTVTKTLSSGKKAVMTFNGGKIKESKTYDPYGMLLKVKEYNNIGQKHSYENLEKGILNKGKKNIHKSVGCVENSDGLKTVLYRANPIPKASNPNLIENMTKKGDLPITQIIKQKLVTKPKVIMFEFDPITKTNRVKEKIYT